VRILAGTGARDRALGPHQVQLSAKDRTGATSLCRLDSFEVFEGKDLGTDYSGLLGARPNLSEGGVGRALLSQRHLCPRHP
jgi:hypothetical protein